MKSWELICSKLPRSPRTKDPKPSWVSNDLKAKAQAKRDRRCARNILIAHRLTLKS